MFWFKLRVHFCINIEVFFYFGGISASQVYGLLFVKVDFQRFSLLETMSEKPENMKNPKFGRVKVNKGKGFGLLFVKVDCLWDPHVEVMLKKRKT